MKTIFLILIFLIMGVVFGFIFALMMSGVSNYFLKRKVTKDALKEDKKFFFRDKPYNLKEQIEYEQEKTFKKKKSFFNRGKKGVSDYGNTIQPGNVGKISGEQIPDGGNRGETSNPSPGISQSPGISPSPREQVRFDSPPTRGEQRRNINRNLSEKGK